jgi:hypothetical protein
MFHILVQTFQNGIRTGFSIVAKGFPSRKEFVDFLLKLNTEYPDYLYSEISLSAVLGLSQNASIYTD